VAVAEGLLAQTVAQPVMEVAELVVAHRLQPVQEPQI